MYDMGVKLSSGTNGMYVDSLSCARVKGGWSEWFRMDSGVRQGWFMLPWLFYVYMDAMRKELKMGVGRMKVRFLEEGRELRLPGLLYADDLVLWVESEEDLRVVVGRSVEACCVGEEF